MRKLFSVAAAIAAALAVMVACTTASCTSVYAQEEAAQQAMLLVASERLQGAYRGTVILAAPYRGGHAGVVLNRPTRARMQDAFDHCPPCALVRDPIYLGGPEGARVVLALTLAEAQPDPSSVPMGPGVWIVIRREVIDALIEAAPNASRYFAGHVVWQPGELEAELEQGMFHVRPLDKAKLMLPDTSDLHEQLLPLREGLTAS